MTISMVPRGQPYGKRQENEAAASEAGLSQGVSQSPPRALPTVPRQAIQAQPFVQGESFDALSSVGPQHPFRGSVPMPQGSPLVDTLMASPNAALRDIARRIRGAQ